MSEVDRPRAATREVYDDLLTDDNFHTPQTDKWWEHETVWFWWFNAERKLGCWIYHYLRSNIDIAGGGVFLFDDTAWFHMETPFYYNYWNTQMPKPVDLRDYTFPGGSRIQMLKPNEQYRLSFTERDIISYDLNWQAACKPWVSVAGDLMGQNGGDLPPEPRHLDQMGHVTGTLQLHGEIIPIDCYAGRDRSWWHLRREPWKDGGGRAGGYITAMASPDLAFFGTGSGFFIRDGIRHGLVECTMTRERDPDHGWATRIAIEGKDSAGREVKVLGESVSRMAMPISGAHGVCWQSLMRYEINGVEAYGDDQDAWPINMWSAFRRNQMGLKDVRVNQLSPEVLGGRG
jgi:hypothetical protein